LETVRHLVTLVRGERYTWSGGGLEIFVIFVVLKSFCQGDPRERSAMLTVDIVMRVGLRR